MAEGQPWKNEGGEKEEEDEVDDIQYKHAKDAVLFMIDVNNSMLSPSPASDGKGSEDDSPLSASLKCAYELMTLRLISNPNDMMGVLLHGVDSKQIVYSESESTAQEADVCAHDCLLIDLCVPSARDVKKLKDISEDQEMLHKLNPVTNSKSIANTLFYTIGLFGTRAANFASRRLFVVTDNDEPHARDARLKVLAAQRAKDLFDLGVAIELFPVTKPGGGFDRAKFYNDVVYHDTSSDPAAPAPLSTGLPSSSNEEGNNLLSSLLTSVRSRMVPKRALFSNLPLELGPGMMISVKGYIIFKRQEPKKTSWVWFGGQEPQVAHSKSAKVADDTGHAVAKLEIRKAYKFGGEQISFSVDEITSIRNFGEPVIRVVGFKAINLDNLPIWANLKGATFLYPSEEDFVGSTRVFSALQQKMLNDAKIAIVWFIPRKNAVPQVAALVAAMDQVDEKSGHILPSGIWLVPLPFADDIRSNPDTPAVTSPDPLIDRTRTIVQQLQLPRGRYIPAKYPNPALQWHYRVLQAMALEDEAPTQPEDKTMPKYKQISKRAGALIREWGEELSKQHQNWEGKHGRATILPKRPIQASAPGRGEPVSKRAKPVQDDEVDDEQMSQLFQKNEVAKLTLAKLKAWLFAKGLSLNGKKADLVDRVESWFEAK